MIAANQTATPMCEVSREGSDAHNAATRTCPICTTPITNPTRARYCSRACQQRAHRLRRGPNANAVMTALTTQLRERRALVDQTVYECTQCEQRLLAERRCDDCNRMCRKLGLGGRCNECDEIVLVSELLGLAS